MCALVLVFIAFGAAPNWAEAQTGGETQAPEGLQTPDETPKDEEAASARSGQKRPQRRFWI